MLNCNTRSRMFSDWTVTVKCDAPTTTNSQNLLLYFFGGLFRKSGCCINVVTAAVVVIVAATTFVVFVDVSIACYSGSSCCCGYRCCYCWYFAKVFERNIYVLLTQCDHWIQIFPYNSHTKTKNWLKIENKIFQCCPYLRPFILAILFGSNQ